MNDDEREREEYFTRMRQPTRLGWITRRHPAAMRYRRARRRSDLRTGWIGPLAVVGYCMLIVTVVWIASILKN